MQADAKILYRAISDIVKKTRKQKGIKYTLFCYENDIPTTTYDNITNMKSKATFYNVAKIVKALGLTFEEFGKLLDENLPANLFDEE